MRAVPAVSLPSVATRDTLTDDSFVSAAEPVSRGGSVAAIAVALVSLTWVVEDAQAVEVVKAEGAVAPATYTPLVGLTVRPPTIACQATGCLVGWTDTRVGYRAWARRIGSDGLPQDPASFLITTEGSGGEAPSIATDGTQFMIAWSDQAGHLFATRVDSEGTRHTESALAGVLAFGGPTQVALAHGGGVYLAVYSAGSDAAGMHLYARRIATNGHFLDAQPIPITTAPSAQQVGDVVWTGSQFIVVWNSRESSTSNVALGARVLGDGTVLDAAGFYVAALSGFSSRPRLAFGGNALLLVAGSQPGLSGGAVDAILLDADGKNGARVNLPIWNFNRPGFSGSAAWTGTTFVVTWTDGPTNNQAVLARVSPSGTVLDPSGVVLTPPTIATPTESPSVAVSAGTSYVAYADHTYPNDSVRVVSYDANGSEGHQSDPPLTTAATPQRILATGRGLGQTLVLWSDEGQGPDAAALQSARISDDGAVLDPQPIVISPSALSKTHASASVAWSSGVYLAAWWEELSLDRGQIEVVRISSDGQVLDAAPTVLATGLFGDHPTQVAPSGSGFLVTWSEGTILSTPSPPRAQLVGADGKPVGSAFQLGPLQASWPYATAGLDTADVAAWTRFDSSNALGLQIEAVAFSGQQGTVLPVTSQQALRSLAFVRSATDLLLWFDGHAGLLMSPAAPFASRLGPVDVGREIGTPSWNGLMFASAAPSMRSPENVQSGVDVSLLSTNLTLVGGPTTVVDRRLQTSGARVVGLGSGMNLVVYSRLMPDADLGHVRGRFQIVDSQPTPRTDDADAGADMAPDGSPTHPTDAAGDPPTTPDGGVDFPAITDAANREVGANASDARWGPYSIGSNRGGCSCSLAAHSPGRAHERWPTGVLTVALALAIRARRCRRRR